AASSFYTNIGNLFFLSGVALSSEFRFLLTNILPLWFSVAFVCITVFSVLSGFSRPSFGSRLRDH
ncbi:MAG: hypothetical protein JRN15_13010, partial [Nitrososphaerota archaeon]|nr:hypothetical protein [Nitrososphaerota archaeon]